MKQMSHGEACAGANNQGMDYKDKDFLTWPLISWQLAASL